MTTLLLSLNNIEKDLLYSRSQLKGYSSVEEYLIDLITKECTSTLFDRLLRDIEKLILEKHIFEQFTVYDLFAIEYINFISRQTFEEVEELFNTYIIQEKDKFFIAQYSFDLKLQAQKYIRLR